MLSGKRWRGTYLSGRASDGRDRHGKKYGIYKDGIESSAALMRGLSYTRIAAEMGCEMSTVKFHVSNMLQKTGLENKLQLALAVSDVKLIADLAEE